MAREGYTWRTAVAAAAAVRAAVLLVAYAVTAATGGPYDSSQAIAAAAATPLSAADALVLRAAGHLANWDGVYFLHIAQRGYTSEQFHAFFPGLPLAIRAVRCVADKPTTRASTRARRG